jgi:hypothetical protein
MAADRPTQDALFDLGQRPADETPDERLRRQNRERQTAWRRRHQFAPPLIESPTGLTFTTCSA